MNQLPTKSVDLVFADPLYNVQLSDQELHRTDHYRSRKLTDPIHQVIRNLWGNQSINNWPAWEYGNGEGWQTINYLRLEFVKPGECSLNDSFSEEG